MKHDVTLIFQRLNSACLRFIHLNDIEQAKLIWQALLKAAQSRFLPEDILKQFIIETTKPLLHQLNLEELDQLYALCQKTLASTHADVALFCSDILARLISLMEAKSTTSQKSTYHNNFDLYLENLRQCTAGYQLANRLPKDHEQSIQAAAKLTEIEINFLQDWHLKSWQFFTQLIPAVMNQESYFAALSWLADLIELHLKRRASPNHRADWQYYRKEILLPLRRQLVEAINIIDLSPIQLMNKQVVESVVTAQRIYNQELRQLLATLFLDCEKILGHSPCAYAIMLVGSGGRDEAILFSDIEYIIVIEPDLPVALQPLVTAYFKAFIQLFAFKITSLGESGFNGNPKGLLIDDGISPRFSDTEITHGFGTVAEILDKYTPILDSGETFSLFHPAYITGTDYSYNVEAAWSGKTLFESYQKSIKERLSVIREDQLQMSQTLADVQFKLHLEDLSQQLTESLHPSSSIALKERYATLISCITFDLAYYHYPLLTFSNSTEHTINTIDIWTQLAQANIVDNLTANTAQYLIALIAAIRILAQDQYGQQLKPELIAASKKASLTVLSWKPTELLASPPLRKQLQATFRDLRPEIIYSLNEALFNKLVAVEWLFLKPLALSLKQLKLSGLAAAHTKLNPLQQSFSLLIDLLIQPNAGIALKDFVDYLVILLWQNGTIVNDYLFYYKKLNEEGKVDFLLRLQALNLTLNSDEIAKLINTLSHQPQKDGWRPILEISHRQWRQTVKKLFREHVSFEEMETARQNGEPIITTRNLDNPASNGCHEYLLTEAASQALFITEANTIKLKPKPEGQSGRHPALPIVIDDQHVVWAKVGPEQPAIETLDAELAGLITGLILPHTLLIKITRLNKITGEEQVDLLLIVEGVHGKTLSARDILANPKRLNRIDRASFTRHFVHMAITNPEDDKGDDYYLEPSSNNEAYYLTRIDRERKFYQPEEIQKKWLSFNEKKVLLVKSILPCLNQAQEFLDDAVLIELTEELETEQVLNRWLKSAESEAEFHRQLFPGQRGEQQIRNLFKRSELEFTLLGVFLPSGTIYHVLNRTSAIQHLVRTLRKTQPDLKKIQLKIRGLHLYGVVQPLLANYYQRSFVEYPYDLLHPEYADKRFDYLTKDLNVYQLSKEGERLTSTASLIAISKNNISVKAGNHKILSEDDAVAIFKGQQESVEQALTELENTVQVNIAEVATALLMGQSAGRRVFDLLPVYRQLAIINHIINRLEEPDHNLTTRQQQRILELIATGTTFISLNLSAFHQVLNDKYLLAILKTNGQFLIKLNLSNCYLLTDASISTIEQYCPNLEKLILVRMAGLTVIKGLKFEQLKYLSIEECKNLVELKILAPNLRKINASNCIKLIAFEPLNPVLEYIDYHGCNQLNLIKLAALVKNSIHDLNMLTEITMLAVGFSDWEKQDILFRYFLRRGQASTNNKIDFEYKEIIINGGKVSLTLRAEYGHPEYSDFIKSYLRRHYSCILIFVSLNREIQKEIQLMKGYIDYAKESYDNYYRQSHRRPLYIVIGMNRYDNKVTYAQMLEYAQNRGADAYFECSSKGEGVTEAFQASAELILEQSSVWEIIPSPTLLKGRIMPPDLVFVKEENVKLVALSFPDDVLVASNVNLVNEILDEFGAIAKLLPLLQSDLSRKDIFNNLNTHLNKMNGLVMAYIELVNIGGSIYDHLKDLNRYLAELNKASLSENYQLGLSTHSILLDIKKKVSEMASCLGKSFLPIYPKLHKTLINYLNSIEEFVDKAITEIGNHLNVPYNISPRAYNEQKRIRNFNVKL